MPASFRLKQPDVKRVMQELRDLDKDLYNQMRREMRSELKPLADKLHQQIPSTSPLSGMSRRPPRGRQDISQRAPFVFKRPRPRISVGTGRIKSGASGVSLVKIVFNDRRPTSAFSVMETAGTQGPNRVARALNTAGFPLRRRGRGKGGRFVIPEFYERENEVVGTARRILQKYARMVSKDLAKRF